MQPSKILQVKLAGDDAPGVPPADATAFCVFTDEPRLPLGAALEDAPRRTIEDLLRAGEFKGEAGDAVIIHTRDATAMPHGARRVLLVGLGGHEDFSPSALRRAAGVAVRRAREARVKHLQLMLPDVLESNASELVRVAAEGAHLGFYENDFYQRHDEDDQSTLEHFTIAARARDEHFLRVALERARIVAEATNWARSLTDEPGGSLPPREFARRAAEMAAESGLTVETLEASEIRERGMGGLWGVGQGSDEPPALIVVRYEPEGASAADELWAFVGKGITFDTGGISIKPAQGMEEMKSDMAGGAAALGALRAIAELKLKRRVVAVVPTAENMPSGRALKPGDIVRTLAGHTIEVVDTDAEGRLVLVDGIAYARSLGASRIVDLATLTGSIIVALGDHRTGLFSNDDEWATRVAAAATRAGEPAWRMPASDDYKKKIESPIADFKNYGGRPDATAAALLLSKFAADTPWVHLDIAATSWHEEPQPHAPAGATGTGVRTLVELVDG
ncbi:MAG TPA: leucyl aminopeptidase [Pyrinomonadaceae bacterium]|jgi:leucyl aminopeptidase|nr:leucyl aminopeptidase [Pyrinomonadaceae bacterium]